MKILEDGIYLTIKDLMRLTASVNESSAGRQYRAIRDAIGKGKKRITIKEYCSYEGVDFTYVWNFLRKGINE